MKFAFAYYPVQFYLITLLATWAFGFIAAYLSHRDQIEKILPFLIIGLCVPCVTALSMIYLSGNKEMIQDFWNRLLLVKFQPNYLTFILLLAPCVILLATALSLAFGYSTDQFLLAKEFSVIKGWGLIGILLPLLLAPLIEEMGWRGYGVDSLRSQFNLFNTSLLFGILWALWHLPLFFVKDYYQSQLWDLGIIYVVNFFVSAIVAAFLMNWVYYHTGRSIPAIILFHSMLNLFFILFRTEPFTKCLVTVLLGLVLIVVLVQDKDFFFDKSTKLTGRLQSELNLLLHQYNFPGATVAYVLSNGEMGAVATGLADRENEQPMTSESRMLAASIGKTFVAATAIGLAKEGRLSLDDPLSKWLGDRSWYSRLPNGKTITLRHLLTHSAGLSNHVKRPDFVELLSRKELEINHARIPELLVEYILDEPPLFEAGKGWHYTDTGYILLGLVVEAATGHSYYDEVSSRFLKPLKLDHTSPSNQRELPLLASGYNSDNNFYHLPIKTVDSRGIMVWNPAFEWTGGGLISNSCDLACWAKLLYEGNAIPQDYLGDLFQSIPAGNEASNVSYGLGVVIEDAGAFGMRYGHWGVVPGYTSSMCYYPKYGIAIAFQINTDDGVSMEQIHDMDNRLAKVIM